MVSHERGYDISAASVLSKICLTLASGQGQSDFTVHNSRFFVNLEFYDRRETQIAEENEEYSPKIVLALGMPDQLSILINNDY